MRKTLALVMAATAVMALAAGPADAAKAKKVSGDISATLLPFPKLAAWGDEVGLTRPGCSSGQEGVNWVGQDLTAPGNGTLTFSASGFTGDHDLYVFQGDLVIARSENAQVGAELAPPEEELIVPLKKGQKITLVACNWLGQPQVSAHYEGTFK